jgi:hypothetical protein
MPRLIGQVRPRRGCRRALDVRCLDAFTATPPFGRAYGWDTVIEIDNLHKAFASRGGPIRAVDGVSFARLTARSPACSDA